MIPTSIDGTDITGATIDGTDVTEITVDGQTVFSPGPPDANLLHSRYDATQITGVTGGSSISSWDDVTGNGFNLDQGNGASYETNELNGMDAVRFEKSRGDRLADFDGWTGFQPWYIFVVMRVRGVSGGNDGFFAENITGDPRVISNQGEWQIGDQNSSHNGATISTPDNYIVTAIGDDPDDGLRVNGSVETSASMETDLDSFVVGSRELDTGYSDISVGEILIYDGSPNVSAVESFLSDKWGISI